MESSEIQFLLCQIDGELRADNIRSLKFLCEPYFGAKKTSNISTGFELFDALKKSKRLNRDYLWELLHLIGRIDLAELVRSDQDCSCSHYQYIDPFRVMLFKLSEELASEDLIRLRYIYGNVSKTAAIKDGTDLFTMMIQHRRLSPTDTSMLGRMMQDIGRHDLADITENFCESRETEHQETDCSDEEVLCPEPQPSSPSTEENCRKLVDQIVKYLIQKYTVISKTVFDHVKYIKTWIFVISTIIGVITPIWSPIIGAFTLARGPITLVWNYVHEYLNTEYLCSPMLFRILIVFFTALFFLYSLYR